MDAHLSHTLEHRGTVIISIGMYQVVTPSVSRTQPNSAKNVCTIWMRHMTITNVVFYRKKVGGILSNMKETTERFSIGCSCFHICYTEIKFGLKNISN